MEIAQEGPSVKLACAPKKAVVAKANLMPPCLPACFWCWACSYTSGNVASEKQNIRTYRKVKAC